MRGLVKKIPISFVWLYTLIAGYALLIICLPFCPLVQHLLMEKFHLRSKSFPQWATLQFAPSMYNFANQLWVTEYLPTPEKLLLEKDPSSFVAHTWTNHYPFWPVTFFDRRLFFEPRKMYYITLRTQFQNQDLWTIYQLNTQGLWKKIEQR